MPPRGSDELGWLAGCWRSESGGRVTEECWLTPRGGVMLGLHRDTQAGRVDFEFLRIGPEGSALAYFASPGGRPATPFRLVESAAERVVFENPQHDYPQRVLYWRDEAGRLHARIEGARGGKTEPREWTWDPIASAWPR